MVEARAHAAPLTPSRTVAPEVVVDRATGVCVTTKPGGVPLLKGNDSTFDFNPAFCRSATAADWERPTKFGTMTVESTLDDVVELELEVELPAEADGSGEVDAESLEELDVSVADRESVCPLRTSAMIATIRATTAITDRRSGRRMLEVPAINRALKTRNPTKAAAASPATTPMAKVTGPFLRRRGEPGTNRPGGSRTRPVPLSTLRSP